MGRGRERRQKRLDRQKIGSKTLAGRERRQKRLDRQKIGSKTGREGRREAGDV